MYDPVKKDSFTCKDVEFRKAAKRGIRSAPIILFLIGPQVYSIYNLIISWNSSLVANHIKKS